MKTSLPILHPQLPPNRGWEEQGPRCFGSPVRLGGQAEPELTILTVNNKRN